MAVVKGGCAGSSVVMVRQVPLIEMESPSWASLRTGDGYGVCRWSVVPVGDGVRAATPGGGRKKGR